MSFSKKGLRITVGIIFLTVLLVSFIPRLYLSNSTDGVVNARTVTLKSPIQGVVTFSDIPKHGTFFPEGKEIGVVINDRVDCSFLHELNTERITLETRMEVMDSRLKSFHELQKRLTSNTEKYKKFSEIQYEKMLRQNASRLVQEQAEYERAEQEYDADRKLFETNAVKRRDYETSEAAFLQSKARISELENRREELQNAMNAIRDGIFLGDGHNDVPYSQQRMDQLVIETALAEATLKESEKRIIGIDDQILTEKERLEKMTRYKIIAPFCSLAWRLPTASGSNVVIDSPLIVLLECRTVFLDVAVSEKMFSNIARGEKIRYRLMSDSHFHEGMVIARIGSGAEEGHYELAAKLIKDPRREFRVWIRIDPEDLDMNPENFYKVGQRVEVKFPKKWNVWDEIIRFFNVF